MKICICAATCFLALLNVTPLSAGEPSASFKSTKEVIVEPAPKWWDAEVSTGWDSHYIFRGVDIIPGSSLYWVNANFAVRPWENGTFRAGAWSAWGLTNTEYKELDIFADYTHTFGNFSITAGYTLYSVFPDNHSHTLFSHELNLGAAYEFDLGFMTLTPGAVYYFNIGPAPGGDWGLAPQASSFLSLRLDGSIPVYKKIVKIDPWLGLGINFRYNASDDPGAIPGNDGRPNFTGFNNFEFGVRVPIQITSVLSVSGYVASTFQWARLVGTAPAIVWSGVQVDLAF